MIKSFIVLVEVHLVRYAKSGRARQCFADSEEQCMILSKSQRISLLYFCLRSQVS